MTAATELFGLLSLFLVLVALALFLRRLGAGEAALFMLFIVSLGLIAGVLGVLFA